MSKPCGGVGAWALEAERAEAEERELATSAASAAPADLFPSLKEAAAAKPKKKKPIPIPLSEFVASPVGPAFGGLTRDEMLRLPTGPKERSADELEGSRFGGGGFRSYGYGGSGDSRRSHGSRFDEESRRGPHPSRDPELPSRADEADSWASAKKPFSTESGSGRRDRYTSLGSSSKADDADTWFSGKKAVPPAHADRWARSSEGFGERPKLVLDRPKSVSAVGGPDAEPARSRPNPFGEARPREAVLAEKGVDWRKVDTEIESKKSSSSRPTSSHSSRPSSAQSSRPGSPGEGGPTKAQPRPKVNPFGDARPREVLLEEKGKDWRKIDSELEHRSIDRPETDEEKLLKEEINRLKQELSQETEGNLNVDPAGQATSLIREEISQKEKDLEKLIHELDDKVRFGQKATGETRPSSGAGSRPSSRSGLSDEPRSTEFTERPRSRGSTRDLRAKPMDDRRGFQGGRELSFFGSRNTDRSGRDGW